jgi:ethanolamine utilization protein EutN
MFLGKVVGDVWASKRVDTLEGLKLLLVRPLRHQPPGGIVPGSDVLVVAADAHVGAGIGETVVVAYGRAARVCIGRGHDIAVEAAIAGIVDDTDFVEGGHPCTSDA